MRPLLLTLTVLAAGIFFPGVSHAQDINACVRYIPAAERQNGIPKGMLMAIAYVESEHNGRPWPWTLNKDGAAHYLSTQQEALNVLLRPDGTAHPNTAVGCMQVFVRYHAQKFAKPGDMLDPAKNVAYAAGYLRELRNTYGSWIEAVARYHSSQKDYQVEYLCRVVTRRVQFRFQAVTPWYLTTCKSHVAKLMAAR